MDRLVSSLHARVDAEAAALETSLGGESACTLHRDGRVTGGMKHREGRLVSLREAARAVESSADPFAALGAHLQRWQDEYRRREGASLPWRAYATGGLEAAEEALSIWEQQEGDLP